VFRGASGHTILLTLGKIVVLEPLNSAGSGAVLGGFAPKNVTCRLALPGFSDPYTRPKSAVRPKKTSERAESQNELNKPIC
jgi:hypothetical protein